MPIVNLKSIYNVSSEDSVNFIYKNIIYLIYIILIIKVICFALFILGFPR